MISVVRKMAATPKTLGIGEMQAIGEEEEEEEEEGIAFRGEVKGEGAKRIRVTVAGSLHRGEGILKTMTHISLALLTEDSRIPSLLYNTASFL